MFERGKIILVPFPFTDLSSQKVRPALIVSTAVARSEDLIVAFISSATQPKHAPTASVIISDRDPLFKETGLKTTSVIRCDKLATLDKRIVLGELGLLASKQIQSVNRALRLALGLRR